MNRTWPQADVPWACPMCKHSLAREEAALACRACGQRYRVVEGGIPSLLPNETGQESGEYRERKEEVKRMFTAFGQALADKGVSRFSTFMNWGYADVGDEEDGRLGRGVNEQSLRLFREIMTGIEASGKDVLEIACGRGGNIRALCKSYRPRLAAGLDLTEANIAFCHAGNRYEHAYFCIGDAEELPVPDACFDIVLNIESSDLYPRIERFYEEVFRVLKPGGMFVYADDMDSEKFNAGERYMRGLGFEMIVSRDISEQALLASDLARDNRLAAINGNLESADAIRDTMGVPGTPLYDDMRAGKRKYKILHLMKRV
ncbi:methyltransferase domain-containing protein [Paenibacillus sp. N4]|uniref:methyltransferase domain-containing protein n=1 Tax=Paenibacillus vietnamensis TaxID=2590547 RepID=UPI001CD0CC4F|nr:methyltransferase domain-containing protein [Paenibacillus vietnamensis]MCA0755178.1 methyltransferase domain-containing protein [Paenibacillus vietnamensis]